MRYEALAIGAALLIGATSVQAQDAATQPEIVLPPPTAVDDLPPPDLPPELEGETNPLLEGMLTPAERGRIDREYERVAAMIDASQAAIYREDFDGAQAVLDRAAEQLEELQEQYGERLPVGYVPHFVVEERLNAMADEITRRGNQLKQ